MSSTGSPYTDGVDPDHEALARDYPQLEGGATLGTICEYEANGEWVIITDFPDKTWGEISDLDDDRADELVVRFLNLETLSNAVFARFERAVGCYEHVDLAREYRDAEGAGNYVRRSDFLKKFCILGPIHPDARGDRP